MAASLDHGHYGRSSSLRHGVSFNSNNFATSNRPQTVVSAEDYNEPVSPTESAPIISKRTSDSSTTVLNHDLLANTSGRDSGSQPTKTMARPSMRPRGESDLGRPANGTANGTKMNGSAHSRHDSNGESSRASPIRRVCSGALFPLPWILAAWAYRLHTHHDTAPKVESQLAAHNHESDNILDACFYAFGITTLVLLSVSAIQRIVSSGSAHSNGWADHTKSKSQTDSSITTQAKRVAIRMTGVWLPFFAAMQTGPLSASLSLVLATLGGFGSKSTKQSQLVREIMTHKFKVAIFAVMTVLALFSHGSTNTFGAFLGCLALAASIFWIPGQIISISRPASSEWQAQFVSSSPSPLMATPKESATTLTAGLVSLFTTIVIYLISPSTNCLQAPTIYYILAATLTTVAVAYFVRSTHFHVKNQTPLLSTLVTTCLLELWISPTFSILFASLASSTLALGAAFLDQTQTNKTTTSHEHSHNHKHSHHDHSHSHGNHSRVTGFLLSMTEPGSVLHSILLERDSRRIAYFGCLNLAFMLIQFFYGFVTGSLGLLTDSIHMLFDCLGLAVGLAAAVVSKWPPSLKFPYGYAKIDTLSGFANGIFLILVSVEIVFDALHRLRDGYELRRLNELLIVSILGFLVNIVGLTAFGHAHHHGHGHSHSHSHGHDHSHSAEIHKDDHAHNHDHKHPHSHDHSHNHAHHHPPTKSDQPPSSHSHSHGHSHGHNENMQGIFLHILADALGSVAVIISTLLTKHSSWNGWDPLASCAIAILIFFSAIPLVKSAGSRLLLSLSDEEEYKCRGTLQGLSDLPGVIGYAGVRLWLKDQEVGEDHHHHHHDHDHSHTHTHNDIHEHCNLPQTSTTVLGVIHIIASKTSDMNVVRQITSDYLSRSGMDVVVHVEQDGEKCWCGGGQNYSPRKISAS